MAGHKSNSRVARWAAPGLLTGLVWLVACMFSLSAWAGRPVRVYEVDVKGGDVKSGSSAPALQDAMRQALVRATGRRESATDPAFTALIAEAPNYVKSYAPGPRGGTQVIFDGVAVERAIVAAGRSVWDQDRPFTLVVLYPPLARSAEDAARVEIERAAMNRGLPVSLMPLSPLDANGTDLGREALMQLGQRYGGDAVLVGRSDAGANGQWQWTLHTSFSSQSWSGALTGGVDGAVDTLASPQGGSLAQTEAGARVEINGVTALADYANVERMLESIPGVRRANVGEANGSAVTFDVLVRGGADAINRALTGSAHLVRSDAAGSRLVYQYRP
jgi:hypothetical protein